MCLLGYYSPERIWVRGPPWKGLGMCRRVTNKWESGFSKANDRVNAEEHRLSVFFFDARNPPQPL